MENPSQNRQFPLLVYSAAAILIAIAILVFFAYRGIYPSRTIVMTTGSKGSSFDLFAQQYQTILARSGIELKLIPSAGSLENLRRLNDPASGVDVGFLDSGITDGKSSPNLVSLGTMFYDPIWFFYRGENPGPYLEGLRGRKLAIGPEGSGTRVVVLKLLELNGIDKQVAELLPLTAADSGEQLLKGKISAAMMMTSWDTPIVRRLLADPQTELGSFVRADAYIALYPFLNKLTVPQGVGDLVANRPPVDTNLVATKTSLVVRKGCRSAIQNLLLNAAAEIHSGPSIFQKAGQFPAPEQIDLPLSKEALQFHKSGTPFLQRYLPFWLADIAGMLFLFLIPVIGVAYPLLRILPGLYGWSVKHRIFRLYGEVKRIEIEMDLNTNESSDKLLERLNAIDSRARNMRVPYMFAQFLYILRQHISLVRERLRQRERP
jgi:TRAP-type uncharacterized transport system substrate-binding protein